MADTQFVMDGQMNGWMDGQTDRECDFNMPPGSFGGIKIIEKHGDNPYLFTWEVCNQTGPYINGLAVTERRCG